MRSTRAGRSATLAAALIAGFAAVPMLSSTPASAVAYDPATDPYSMAAMATHIGATAWWNAGFTGQGVDVAVIDTGVSPVAGLNTPGKIINGPDLSLESQAPNLAQLDTNGHGTFMAGLIAGKDATLTAPYSAAPASAYRGVAPDARIVNVKVGTADGGTDVSQVIAAINWVVAHKADNGMNIRVLNLSYGTNSSQLATVDPLSYAVERAWKSGIVVVAAAGNSGFQVEKGLANPAYNRYVVGVGGYDTKGTPARTDDLLGTYSAGVAHSTDRGPDFVAPGSHTQGLSVPNSFLDATHPEGRLGTRYFRGSGTSQSAAIASGIVALLLQKYPGLTPDQVKNFIAGNATVLASEPDPDYSGKGEISLPAMATKTPGSFVQNFPASTGTGSLELARGTDHLTRDGVVLKGEKDIFGKPFAPGAAGSAWTGGMWNGSSWTGSSWTGSSWTGSSWTGSSWTGSSWTGSSWSGSSWTGSSWSGGTWT